MRLASIGSMRSDRLDNVDGACVKKWLSAVASLLPVSSNTAVMSVCAAIAQSLEASAF